MTTPTDHTIRAHGKYLARVRWTNHEDGWRAHPNGTHDLYVHDRVTYVVLRAEEQAA